MPTLDTLQLPRIDTSAYGGREAKKIAGHLYQVEEQLRYVLGHLDEDNLSEGLKSKIESGGMGSELVQTLDAITLRVSGQDDAMSELRVSLGGISSTVQEQGGAITQLEQTAQGLAVTVEQNKNDAASALQQTAESIKTTVAETYSTKEELTSTVEQRAESILSTVSDGYTSKTELRQTMDSLRLTANSEGYVDAFAGATWEVSGTKSETFNVDGKYSNYSADKDTVADIVGRKLNVSFECRVDAAMTTTGACGAIIVIQYASGNDSQWLQLYSGTYAAQEEFVKVNKSYDLKEERPTGIYIQTHLNGSGSFTIRNIAGLVQTSGEAATSTLTLMAGETELSSASIVLKGAVTFRNLRTLGETVINGSNITTGEISANLIKTGVIENHAGTTVYDLNNGTIQMGATSGAHIVVDREKVRWWLNASNPTGIFYSVVGVSFIGATSRYVYMGWITQNPNAGVTHSEPTDSRQYYGVRIEESNKAHWNVSKLECNGSYDNGNGTIEAAKIAGSVNATAASINTASISQEYGAINLCAASSPIPQFFDNGSGVIGEDGKCWIFPRDEFLSAVSANVKPQWQVTSYGGPLTVQRDGTAAIVSGEPGTEFDWLCIMPQKGCETIYCAPAEYDWSDNIAGKDYTAEEELNGIERLEQALDNEVCAVTNENSFLEETWPEQLERSEA